MTTTTSKRNKGPRGIYAGSAETRTAILEAALDVFADAGYRAGSLREVGDKVGMTPAGILHHFKTKTALLAALLELRDARSYEYLPAEAADPTTTLRGLLALISYNATVPGMTKLYTTLSAEATSPDHPAHEYFVTRYRRTRQIMEDVMVALNAEGRLYPYVDPHDAATATIAFMDGVQLQWLLEPTSVDMPRALRKYLKQMIDIGDELD